MGLGMAMLTGPRLLFAAPGAGSAWWNSRPRLPLERLGSATPLAPPTAPAPGPVPALEAGGGSGGRFLRRFHLLWRSPRNLALRPSHAPSGSRLVKRLLQPTLASGSVARWPHCTSLLGPCQVAQSSDLQSACLTGFIPEHDLFGGCLKGRVEIW